MLELKLKLLDMWRSWMIWLFNRITSTLLFYCQIFLNRVKGNINLLMNLIYQGASTWRSKLYCYIKANRAESTPETEILNCRSDAWFHISPTSVYTVSFTEEHSYSVVSAIHVKKNYINVKTKFMHIYTLKFFSLNFDTCITTTIN